MAGDTTLHQLLKQMVEMGASDLHLTTNSPPMVRLDGQLIPLPYPPLTVAETKQLAYSVLTDTQKHRFEENLELDFSFGVKGLARFRANNFIQRGAVAGVYRQIPYEILGFRELGLPPVVELLCDKPRGLILVTGPTGSGKTTTLAAMLDRINREKQLHIVTIEDPIEFLHSHKKCIVNQRELHADTHSFPNALSSVLREDPDVVLVGEMRDLETIESALRIAETGHLTLATLHTNSATSSINRIIDVFPAHQQTQIRTQLSFVLEGILCQSLLERASGKGRAMAMEILVPNAAIRNLIREDKIHQIYSMMQTGQSKFGMQTFNQSLATLYHRKLITLEIALSRSSNPDELQELINRGAGSTSHDRRPPRPASARDRTRRIEERAMPNFVWKGRNRSGLVQEGVLAADSKDIALASLRRQNIVVTGIRERGKEISLTKMGRKVPPKTLAVFTRQFSVMIDAGLPLVQCLEILANQQEHKNFQKILLQVRQDVEAGSTLADAMRRHPKAFNNLYVNMVAAGEAGGILDTILQRLSVYIEKAVKLRLAGQVGADLPGRGHRDRRDRRRGHPPEGHPDVRGPLHEPRGRAAVSDAHGHHRVRTSSRGTSSSSSSASAPRSSPSGAITRPTADAASWTDSC